VGAEGEKFLIEDPNQNTVKKTRERGECEMGSGEGPNRTGKEKLERTITEETKVKANCGSKNA